MRLLVTGATGFVGGHLCGEAVRRGVEVRGTVRNQDSPLPIGVSKAVVPDLDDAVALDAAVCGVDVVVHLAARVHVMQETAEDPLGAFRRVNVQGTANLLASARRAGVSRLILLSSVKVHGEGQGEPYKESDSPAPCDPYSVSKLEAEERLAEEAGPMEWAVLRPPLVYGPGVDGNFLRLLGVASAARRYPLPLRAIPNRRSLLYVGNLVDACLHLAKHPSASGSRALISDGEDLSTPELILRIGRAGGWTPRLLPAPMFLLRAVAQVARRTAEAERLLGSLTVQPQALMRMGWAPPFSVDQGLKATVDWWTSCGSP